MVRLRFGLISFILPIVEIFFFMIIATLADTLYSLISPLIIPLLMISFFLPVIGIFFGIISLLKKEQNKLYPIIGIVLASVILLILIQWVFLQKIR